MYQLRQWVPEELWDRVRNQLFYPRPFNILPSSLNYFLFLQICLVFVGSCRGSADEARVKDMKDLCRHLSLENNVQFRVNISYDELKKELQEGTIGLHAMWNEHFGIGN